jgi:hypothetical protein
MIVPSDVSRSESAPCVIDPSRPMPEVSTPRDNPIPIRLHRGTVVCTIVAAAASSRCTPCRPFSAPRSARSVRGSSRVRRPLAPWRCAAGAFSCSRRRDLQGAARARRAYSGGELDDRAHRVSEPITCSTPWGGGSRVAVARHNSLAGRESTGRLWRRWGGVSGFTPAFTVHAQHTEHQHTNRASRTTACLGGSLTRVGQGVGDRPRSPSTPRGRRTTSCRGDRSGGSSRGCRRTRRRRRPRRAPARPSARRTGCRRRAASCRRRCAPGRRAAIG